MWHGSYDGITGCSHQKEEAGSVTINKHKQAAATISATLLALLVILTFNRVSDWHDSQTLKSEKSYDTNKQISQPLTQAVIIN